MSVKSMRAEENVMKHKPTQSLKILLEKVTPDNIHPSVDVGLDEMLDSLDPTRHGGEAMVAKPVGHEEITENNEHVVDNK
jgi:hypothetical protein